MTPAELAEIRERPTPHSIGVLIAEIDSLQTQLNTERRLRCDTEAEANRLQETLEVDAMALLAKLATGEGGRRTGELKRLGFLEWTVTDKGRAALASQSKAQP